MKYFFLLQSFLLATIVFGQTDWQLTSPIMVADGYGNDHPQIEISGDNRVLISWTDPVSDNVYLTKHNVDGSFSDPIQLNPEGFPIDSYNWSGPDIAVEGSNVYVVFRASDYNSYMVKSTDNGESFGDTIRIAEPSVLFPFYPDMAVHNDTVFVTYMKHEDEDGSSPDYVFTRSTDGGLTFETQVLVSELFSDEVCDCCPPEIVVNDQYVVVFFRNNESNIREIKGVLSYDRGETFTDWFSADDFGWYLASCPSTGPDARFISNDIVASVYKTYTDGGTKVYLNRYDLSTETAIGTQEITATDFSPISVNYPQINVDDDNIGVVWEGLGDGTSIDVFFNGMAIDEPEFDPVNALNLTEQSGVQQKPDIAIRNGIYQVVYANSNDQNLYFMEIGESNQITANHDIEFNMYPNPVSSVLNLDIGDKAGRCVIWTVTGTCVFEGEITKTTSINVVDWNEGVYILTFHTENGSGTKSFSIRR